MSLSLCLSVCRSVCDSVCLFHRGANFGVGAPILDANYFLQVHIFLFFLLVYELLLDEYLGICLMSLVVEHTSRVRYPACMVLTVLRRVSLIVLGVMTLYILAPMRLR